MTIIKAIKHLSTNPRLIEVLQNSNAMEVLVGVLAKCIKGTHANVSDLLKSECRAEQAGNLFAHLPDDLQHDSVVQS
mgnify:CR=1 FL=1